MFAAIDEARTKAEPLATCRQCPRKVAQAGWVTCGASECQEAEYQANRERNMSKRRRSK
jgi:hypothetical protein